mmetsp:Transcript_51885/g.82770  ORF Transcript_51885/g.82770 Transcript_51885/m.82770 type:complete len:264 (-) Transcript_51885:36-827(-)
MSFLESMMGQKKYYNCPSCNESVWAYGAFVGSPCWKCLSKKDSSKNEENVANHHDHDDQAKGQEPAAEDNANSKDSKLAETAKSKHDNNINESAGLQCNQCVSLKREVKEMASKLQQIQREKQQLERRCAELSSANDKLNEECKELHQTKSKYYSLLRKDEANYAQWTTDIVCDWIIQLNAQFKTYEESLRNKLKEEGVNGSLLAMLDKNDLHRFGVIQFEHKVMILQQMQRLVTSKTANAAQAVDPSYPTVEGGNDAPTAYL